MPPPIQPLAFTAQGAAQDNRRRQSLPGDVPHGNALFYGNIREIPLPNEPKEIQFALKMMF